VEGTRIRKVSPSGVITTIAGNGTSGLSGDGGPATSAQLIAPGSLALDAAGDLVLSDGNRIREVSPSGTIATVAGSGPLFEYSFSGDGGPATAAQVIPLGLATDGLGNVFIADGNQRIRKISADGIITTIAGYGDGVSCCFSCDGGPAVNAQLQPSDVAVDGQGNVFIADVYNLRVRRVSPGGIITTVAGDGLECLTVEKCGPAVDGGPATGAHLIAPQGVAVDSAGDLFIADAGYALIRKVAPSGIITTVAGSVPGPSSGDGGPATSAQLNYPFRVTVDASGELFITTARSIRKVSPDGIIATVAGNGTPGYSGDGGPATGAELDTFDPANCDGPGGGLALDGAGDLLIADSYNNRVREVSSNGTINTVAGAGQYGFSGDGGPATSALLGTPFGVAFDGLGNLFVTDLDNSRIRKVSPDGIIATVAGNGAVGFAGDGGPANSIPLAGPGGIAADGAGNIYFVEEYNQTVRVLRPTNTNVLITAVVDAASQKAAAVSPGELVVIYGAGLGPAQLVQNQASNGQFGTQSAGTAVSFNGIAAPVLYASATQVAVVVPYAMSGTSAQITVSYQGETSAPMSVPVALVGPSIFTLTETGGGQAAAINPDGTPNTAANPVKIGDSILMYATGGGQTSPGGVDGKVGGSAPVLPVMATIGGIPANVQSVAGAAGQIAGLMQVKVQIPSGVQPGGYVPVVLQVGNESTTPGAVWIAISGN
jgi:uncharacterized protein (TIGR03437 family)